MWRLEIYSILLLSWLLALELSSRPVFAFTATTGTKRAGDRFCTTTRNSKDDASDQQNGDKKDDKGYQFLILGGAGKIGTAVACHLLMRAPPQSQITLVGRQAQAQGQAAVQQVWNEYQNYQQQLDPTKSGLNLHDDTVSLDRVQFAGIRNVWDTKDPALRALVQKADCVILTAGPFLDKTPSPLMLAMECQCPVYVDISDPVAFLETSLLQDVEAREAGTTALLAAGAFPGMSNVLAMEAANSLSTKDNSQPPRQTAPVKDVRFHYFTAGLGGSGPLNLFITNLGFGEPMAQFEQGQLRFFTALSGRLLGQVDFYLSDADCNQGFGNEEARARVGTKQVFAWPFPEAATVPTELQARGNSWASMGTAPELWNVMLGLLVQLVPRSFWRNQTFSKFMADFSQPLVWLTDQALKWQDVKQVGETHAMRIDVTADELGWRKSGSTAPENGVSIVQAHDSFRSCVGQSCAEFALDCLQHPNPGVYLTEHRYRDAVDRTRIIDRLTSTPGTFCYTGPVQVASIPTPTNLGQAILDADDAEDVSQNLT